MVSDLKLVNRLWDVLQTSDLNTTTANSVRRTLESEFGVDLSDCKAFIRDQIDSFLQTCVQRTHNNTVTVEEEEDEEAIHEEASETLKLEDNKSESEEEEESDGQRSKKRRFRGNVCRSWPLLIYCNSDCFHHSGLSSTNFAIYGSSCLLGKASPFH